MKNITNINTVKNILNDMLESLYEFESGDVVYYQRQVSRIMKYIETLENSSKEEA